MTERSNIEGHWDEFRDWCEENGVSLEDKDDWEPWWRCWNAALDAREDNEENKLGSEIKTVQVPDIPCTVTIKDGKIRHEDS